LSGEHGSEIELILWFHRDTIVGALLLEFVQRCYVAENRGRKPQRTGSPGKGLAFLVPCDYIGSRVLKALSVFISRDYRLIKRKV
jgi:hypothetical protein